MFSPSGGIRLRAISGGQRQASPRKYRCAMACCAASPCGAQPIPARGSRKSGRKQGRDQPEAEPQREACRTGQWPAWGTGRALRGDRAASRASRSNETPCWAFLPRNRRTNAPRRRGHRQRGSREMLPRHNPAASRSHIRPRQGSLMRPPKDRVSLRPPKRRGPPGPRDPLGRRRPPPASVHQKAEAAHVQRSGWSPPPAGCARARPVQAISVRPTAPRHGCRWPSAPWTSRSPAPPAAGRALLPGRRRCWCAPMAARPSSPIRASAAAAALRLPQVPLDGGGQPGAARRAARRATPRPAPNGRRPAS